MGEKNNPRAVNQTCSRQFMHAEILDSAWKN